MIDVSHLQLLITWGGTFLAGAFGVGVGYATLKEQLKSVKEKFKIETDAIQRDFETYRDTTTAAAAAAAIVASEQLTSIKERVSRVEGKTEAQVGYERCRDMRDECSGRMVLQLADISKQVSENRTVVISWMQQIQKVVGRVERFMESQNGKSNHHED